MVAYSFKAQFAEPIVTLAKRQTVRGVRKRHARPGEALQLYTGMRTRGCRKLLDRDPVCIDVRPIVIDLDVRHPHVIKAIRLDGIDLSDDEIEAFAVADGFGSGLVDGYARGLMGDFWAKTHDWNGFLGVVIRWEPQ